MRESAGADCGPILQRRSYLMSEDLCFLAGVLKDSAAELEAAGVIDPRDEGYARVRLGLAAIILGRARDGECDPAELRRIAVRSVAPGFQPRFAEANAA